MSLEKLDKKYSKSEYCVAQLVGVLHHAPKVASLILSQDTLPGLWDPSPVAGVQEATDGRFALTFMFLSPSL